MSNTYLNSTLISKEAVAILKVASTFLNTGYKTYENMFNEATYKPGDTINVRQDNFFIGERGDVATGEALTEASLAVTIKPKYSVKVPFRPTDLQRDIADFGQELLMPAVRRLCAMMNKDIQQDALSQVNYWTGSAAANLNTFASLDQVNPVMDNLAMDPSYKRYAVLNPTQAQQLRSSATLQNSFVDPLNKEITMDAMLGRLAGFDVFKDQAVGQFTAGTHTTATNITVKTAVSSGNTIELTGVDTGTTFVEGDVISIAGTYEYDPVLRQKTNRNMQFVVTSGGTADGATDVTVTVSPAIQFTGSRKNIFADGGDTEIAAGAVVSTEADHTPNVCYTERGLITCMPPMEPFYGWDSSVHTEDGVSLRVTKFSDPSQNLNYLMVDGQLASRWVPNQAVRLVSL